MADPGFVEKGANPKEEGESTYYSANFPENSMKMKKIGLMGRESGMHPKFVCKDLLLLFQLHSVAYTQLNLLLLPPTNEVAGR